MANTGGVTCARARRGCWPRSPSRAIAATAGCGQARPETPDRTKGAAASTSPSAEESATAARSDPDVAMAAPAALRKPTLTPDLLVYSQDTLSLATVAAVKKVPGVRTIETFSLAQFFAEERSITYAAVDPATFRRYTPSGSAQTLDVWKRVAGGEMAIAPKLGRADPGQERLREDGQRHRLAEGAHRGVRRDGAAAARQAAVHRRRGQRALGEAAEDEAGQRDAGLDRRQRAATGPEEAAEAASAPPRASGSSAANLDINATQTAVLTGGSVSDALGTLTLHAPTPTARSTPTRPGSRATSAPRACRSWAGSPATGSCCPSCGRR